MNFLDWKLVVALGTSAIGIIFALKMTPEAVERVSIHAIDAGKECAVAAVSSR